MFVCAFWLSVHMKSVKNKDFSTNSHATTKCLKHSSNLESGENVWSSNVIEFEFELRHIQNMYSSNASKYHSYHTLLDVVIKFILHCHAFDINMACMEFPKRFHCLVNRWFTLCTIYVKWMSPTNRFSTGRQASECLTTL